MLETKSIKMWMLSIIYSQTCKEKYMRQMWRHLISVANIFLYRCRNNHQWHRSINIVAVMYVSSIETWFNSLRPRRNRRHFADDIFKCIALNENVWIALKISLEFVPKVRINNNPALVQIMAWRRPGDKPLSQPMMVSLLTHICVTRPQWVKNNIGFLKTGAYDEIPKITESLCYMQTYIDFGDQA